MKKLLLLFAVLLGTVGAWAQTFTLQKSKKLDNPEYQYLMKNADGIFMDSKTSYVSSTKENTSGKFAFFAYEAEGATENDILIYSIDAHMWVSYDKAAGYDNKRDFAELVDDKNDANPWRFSTNTNSGITVYQFAPHNTTGIATKYMNWFEGTANNKEQNSVGLYSTAANGDNGSAWILWPANAQECYLQDIHGTFLNMKELGTDANGYEKTLVTLTTEPEPLYVTVATDGRWQIHTTKEGGNYLKQSNSPTWNSKVSENSEDFYWTVEDVTIGEVKYIVLKNTKEPNSGYLGNDSHASGTPLYVNTSKNTQGIKLVILDPETEFAHITYNLDYKGQNKGTEKYYSPVGMKFPKLLFTKDYIYPVMPSGTSGNVDASADGNVYKINLVDNLPFKVSENFESATWYTMKIRSTKHVCKSTNIPYPNSTTAPAADSEDALWAFIGNPFDGIKVLNRAAGAQQTLSVDGSSNVIMKDGDFPWIIKEGNGGFVLLQEEGTTKYVHDYSSKLMIWNNGSAKNDNGSAFTVKDAEAWGYPETVTVGDKITDLSNITDGQMVVFKVADKNRYLTLTKELETEIHSSAEGLSVFRLHRHGEEKNQFTIESERDGYYFPNINNSGWPKYYMTNEGTPNVYKFTNATSENTDGKFFIGSTTPYSGNTYGWFDSNDSDFTGWQGSGANATYEIYSVTVSGEVSQITQNAILTDTQSGDVYQSNYLAFPETNPTITGISSQYITNASLNNNVYTANVTFPFRASKESGMTNPTMISSFNNSKYKWFAVGNKIKTIQNESITNANVYAHLWAIYPTFTNTSFSFVIKSLANSNYVEVLNAENDHSGDEVGLSNNASNFTFENGRFKYSTGHFLSTNSSNLGDGTEQYVGTHNSTSHVGSQNQFDTPSYSVKISDALAATLYTPIAVTIPEGVTAKYVKKEGNEGSRGVLHYTKLEKTIPANTAVVLTGEAADYTFTVANDVAAVTDNMLFGYGVNTAVVNSGHESTGDKGSVYALANINKQVGFYHFAKDQYSAGKAYLDIAGLSSGSSVRMFNIFDEETETGIVETENGNVKTENVEIYDLSGRRVEKAKKGIFIVNGKKVIK